MKKLIVLAAGIAALLSCEGNGSIDYGEKMLHDNLIAGVDSAKTEAFAKAYISTDSLGLDFKDWKISLPEIAMGSDSIARFEATLINKCGDSVKVKFTAALDKDKKLKVTESKGMIAMSEYAPMLQKAIKMGAPVDSTTNDLVLLKFVNDETNRKKVESIEAQISKNALQTPISFSQPAKGRVKTIDPGYNMGFWEETTYSCKVINNTQKTFNNVALMISYQAYYPQVDEYETKYLSVNIPKLNPGSNTASFNLGRGWYTFLSKVRATQIKGISDAELKQLAEESIKNYKFTGKEWNQ